MRACGVRTVKNAGSNFEINALKVCPLKYTCLLKFIIRILMSERTVFVTLVDSDVFAAKVCLLLP